MTADYASDAATSVVSGATSVTVNKPAGCVIGDMLVAFAMSNVVSPGWAPNGTIWNTLLTNTLVTVYWRIVDGTEGATFTFDRTGANTAPAIVTVARVIGAGRPVHAVYTGVGSNMTIVLTGVTAGVDNLLLHMLSAVNTIADTFTPPGGTTRRTAGGAVASGSAHPYAIGTEVVQAGATGTRTWTRTGVQTTRSVLIAFAPQPKGEFLALI